MRSQSKLSTPVAIILGALAVAAAIYLSQVKVPSVGSPSTGNGKASPKPTQVSYTIDSKLLEYAQAASLDTDKFSACYQERRPAEEIQQDLSDGQAAGVGGTPTFFINGELLVGAQPYSEIKKVIDKHLQNPQAAASVEVSTENEPFLGSENAPVTLVEFTDFQCPFCRRAFENNFAQLKKEYISTNKVKYVVRDFPLEQIHQNAISAAIAANCAFEQGGNKAYFTYHDLLFQNQSEWEVARSSEF